MFVYTFRDEHMNVVACTLCAGSPAIRWEWVLRTVLVVVAHALNAFLLCSLPCLVMCPAATEIATLID